MKRKYLIIFLFIFSVDLTTKLLSINFLPFQKHVFLVKDRISLYLIYNEGSTGGQAEYFLQQEPNKNLTLLFSSLNSLLLVSYIVLVYNINIRRLYKWLIVLVLYILTSVLLQVVKPNFSDVELSNWATSVITKLAALTLYSAVFLLVKDNLIRVFSLIIISAGLSNLINHFYYPYQVIDFINVEGSYQLLKIGVFNIADVAFDIGFIGLIISVLVYICKSKKKHHSYHSKLFN